MSSRPAGADVRSSPDTRTRRRTVWVDPRFAIGLALVGVSVASVVGIVAAADRTVAVYAAASTLVPGDRVTEANLAVHHVRMGGAESRYLGPDTLPEGGALVVRALGEGELVPLAAVGELAGARSASVVVTVHGELSHIITPGAVVDVWAASEGDRGAFGPPSVLVQHATVVRVIDTAGLMAARTESVELLVPRERIARVLEASNNGDAISLIPTSLPVRQ